MVNFFELIPYSLLAIWFVFSVYYLIRAVRTPDKINPYIFESIPQVFPTIGILGTFIGIAYGLWGFNPDTVEKSLPELIRGLKTAFFASIAGVSMLIIFSKFTAIIQRRNEKGKKSDELIALNKLILHVSSLRVDLEKNFTYTDENSNKVKATNVLRDIYEESKKQSQALQSFSTDLSTKIEAGFDTIMSNQIQKGVIPELQLLKAEIENLGKKLQDPATEMTQSVVKGLESALGNMIQEFKTSMSGSTKSELEYLSVLLSKAGGSLADFPAKLQSMTDNLNENFRGLQGIVQQIAKQTLSQSELSTGEMKRQVEEMSEILKNKVGDLQIGQEMLITKQSENLQISDKLLDAFNVSIEKMNGLSEGLNESVSKFKYVQTELSSAAEQLRAISNNVSDSSHAFKEAQLKFSEHSDRFLESNAMIIEKILRSLSTAKDVSTDYAERFSVIEKGLRGIFSQIQTGLEEYKNSVGESLDSFLGKYTDALTKTAEALSGAASKQEDILEELTEQLDKFNGRK